MPPRQKLNDFDRTRAIARLQDGVGVREVARRLQLPPLALEQQAKLEENFRNNRNPSDLDVVILAAEVGLSEHTVKVDDPKSAPAYIR
nr:hypothetical protein BaRGS_019326 [Batillaria attramentaria]